MAVARRVGNSIRCGIHGCDHTLGTVERGPILRDGSDAVNLILAGGFHPGPDGTFRQTALESHATGAAQDVWAIQHGSLTVALAPQGPRALIVCPGCRIEIVLDIADLGLTPLSPASPTTTCRTLRAQPGRPTD